MIKLDALYYFFKVLFRGVFLVMQAGRKLAVQFVQAGDEKRTYRDNKDDKSSFNVQEFKDKLLTSGFLINLGFTAEEIELQGSDWVNILTPEEWTRNQATG
jgi:hypothetical protein